MDWEEKAILQELRIEQRRREMILRFGTPPDQRQRLARIVEARVALCIEALFGYSINQTSHKASFDLWVDNVKVEVKGSHWQGRRYQANIRNHSADILIFDAINGLDHYFIIPMAQVNPRRTVEITSYDVLAYTGQWAAYLEAWDVLALAVRAAPARHRQLDLWGRSARDRKRGPRVVPIEGV